MQKIKTLSPKLDVIFQALFGEKGSEKITKRFLESILKEKIEKIDLDKNPILKREFKDDKLGVLDIIAKIEGKDICNIEMQLVEKANIIERILFYWSRVYSREIKIGNDYKDLPRTIVILITDFEIKELEKLPYHTTWKLIEAEEKMSILTNKLRIDIIQLPKVKKEDISKKDELLDWLHFLEAPKSERVIEKMKENEELKEAVEKLDNLSANERMQRIADLREKAILDEKATYNLGVERGIEEGKKEGIKEGIKSGIKEGEQKAQIEIVQKMLKENFDIEIIKNITNLSIKEIEEIKRKMK